MTKRKPQWELQVRYGDHMVIAAGPNIVGFDLRVGSRNNRRSYWYWRETGEVRNPLTEENRHDDLVAAGAYAHRLIDSLNSVKETH